MKKIYLFFTTLLIITIPTFVEAHVKWFVDPNVSNKVKFYEWGSIEVLIWSAIVLAIVLLFSILDKYVPTPKYILDLGIKKQKIINRVSQSVLGLFLISVGILWQVVLVPDLMVTESWMLILNYLQIGIGLMFLFNITPRSASIGLTLMCFGLIFTSGIITFLENLILLTLAIYFFIINSKEDSKVFRLNKHAVEIVRIGTGISLIVLAFTEKLLYPELSLQFLQIHHWNFMQPIFPWFTDKLFVLSTGFAEIIFGILFLLGYMTRTTTILIAIFFGISVTTMLVQFKEWEVEDLVVYSAAILFLFYGHGKTKFFYSWWPNSKIHKSIVK